jgi:two-component system response regulator (stage 0 sporulation protein F)
MAVKILIIDDEPLVLTTMNRALSSVGYDITAVPDAGGFIDAISSSAFDLVITDLHLSGANTQELIKKAKEKNPDIKMMIVSGSSAPPMDEKYYLQKPFRIDELRKKVKEILDEPR